MCIINKRVVHLFSYQSFKELPTLLDHGLRNGASLSISVVASTTDMLTVEKGKEGHGQETEVQRSLPQRLV